MNTTTAAIRIVIVDDHQMLREGLRQLISSVPGLAIVGEAFNSSGAMEQIRASLPDLVLVDVHLSGENGVDLTRHILKEFPTIKVVALSSDAEVHLIQQALQAGVSGYLLKHGGLDELIRGLRAVMDHRIYLAPEISSAVIMEFMRTPAPARATHQARLLTQRERLLLQLVAQGKRNKEIAEDLSVALKSAETYRSRLMKKLGCGSTAELVRYAIREGIIEP